MLCGISSKLLDPLGFWSIRFFRLALLLKVKSGVHPRNQDKRRLRDQGDNWR